MISARKLRANLANARHSTGPKTAAGLAIAARNARRHGLAIPIFSDSVLTAEIEILAQRVAPDGSPPILLDLARRIAEAQVDIMRVRRARMDLIARAFSDARFAGQHDSMPLEGFLWKNLELARGLMAFERYERRAFSRRKFAIRAFDAEAAEAAKNVQRASAAPGI